MITMWRRSVWISILRISLLRYILCVSSLLVPPTSSLYVGAAHVFSLWSLAEANENYKEFFRSIRVQEPCLPIAATTLLDRLRRKRVFDFEKLRFTIYRLIMNSWSDLGASIGITKFINFTFAVRSALKCHCLSERQRNRAIVLTTNFSRIERQSLVEQTHKHVTPPQNNGPTQSVHLEL